MNYITCHNCNRGVTTMNTDIKSDDFGKVSGKVTLCGVGRVATKKSKGKAKYYACKECRKVVNN